MITDSPINCLKNYKGLDFLKLYTKILWYSSRKQKDIVITNLTEYKIK